MPSGKKQKRKNVPPVRKTAKKKPRIPTFIKRLKRTEHLFLLAFATILLLFAVQLAVFVPSYQTNDDIGMTFVASGTGTCPAPDEHLRYSHVLLGLVLKKLYTAFPGFPWYGSYHFLVHFLSMTVLLYVVLRRKFTWRRFFFFLVYFFSIELYFLNNLQFTITACIAGQSGLLLFLASLGDESRKSRAMLAGGVSLVVLSYIIRTNSFFLMALMAAPVLAVAFHDGRRNRSVVLKYAVFLGLTAASVSLLGLYNKAYYERDPAWQDFFAINALKSRFIDFKHTVYNDDTKPVFDEVGWSRNDYYMLLTWFFADETLYSKENLEKILSHFPSFKTYLSPGDVVRQFLSVLSGMFFFLITAAFFSLYALGEKRNRVSIIGTLAVMFVLMAYLIVTKRLPARVYQPMFSFLAAMTLFLADGLPVTGRNRFGTTGKAILAFTLLGLVLNVYDQLGNSGENREKNARFKQTISKINPRDDQLFIVWGATLPYTDILPFDNLDFMEHFKLISLGTTLRTPITKKRMEEFSIDDIYTAPYEKDDVFLVVNDTRYLYYYTVYIEEHYDTKIQFRYYYVADRFYVVRVIDESDPDYTEDAKTRAVTNPYR